jgi:hypothetical protein
MSSRWVLNIIEVCTFDLHVHLIVVFLFFSRCATKQESLWRLFGIELVPDIVSRCYMLHEYLACGGSCV